MKRYSFNIAKITILSLFVLMVASAVMPSFSAHAQAAAAGDVATADNNALTSTMCNVMKLVTGGAGKAFAAFAIISVGIGFFTGKVSWGLMIGVAMGIAAMFGAPSIVSAITGQGAFDCK